MKNKRGSFLFPLCYLLLLWVSMGYASIFLKIAGADELSKFRLSGYGTLSVPVDDRGNMAPMRDISQEPDEELTYSIDHPWQLDSRLGVQAEYRFSDKVDGAIQWVLRNQTDADLLDRLESAYIRVHVTPWVEIRGGRFAYDAFLMSDIRNIGYAYLWVRPPTEFYGWIPIFSVDGMDVTWHIERDDAFWRIRAQGGCHRFKTSLGGDPYEFETSDLWSISLSRQSGPFQLKAGYSRLSSDNEVRRFEPLLSGLDSIALAAGGGIPNVAAEAKELRGELGFQGTGISYMTLGAVYDDGRYVVQGEVARSTSTADVLPHGITSYISAGIRLGDFTPFCMVSSVRAENDLRGAMNDWRAIGEDAQYLQSQTISIINSTRMDQRSVSLGLRWDFYNQAALKVQWDTVRIKAFGYGLWWYESSMLNHSGRINLGTISVEFIF